MNKQQLAAKIWESANKMRSKIEANEYKDYILGFIFYKFLSDRQLQFYRENGFTDDVIKEIFVDQEALHDNESELNFVRKNLGYFIDYDDLFSTWVTENFRDSSRRFGEDDVKNALQRFDRIVGYSGSATQTFKGIFTSLSSGLSKLSDTTSARTKAIRDLLGIIKDIPMLSRQDYDALGYIYEYLLEKFASNAGKKAGEFYTPHEVSVLISEIVAEHCVNKQELSVYDPTSGSGSLLLNIGQAIAKQSGKRDAIKYYAQELKQNTYNLTRMNLIMRGIKPSNIVVRCGDTLEQDWPYFDESDPERTYNPLYVDAVVSNPPYSQHWDPVDKGMEPRYKYGIAPKSKADYAFLLHDLYHLRPDGIMCIVLPHGVLFRGGEEGVIRKNLIENRHIHAVIGLPSNIFYGTGIPTIIMVLRQKRSESDILMIDASKGFVKDGKNNKLRARDIKRICDVVVNRTSIDGFSKLVSIDDVRANDYNLNIPRYVNSSEQAESFDIYASMFGGVPVHEVEQFSSFWKAWPSLKGEVFSGNGAYLEPTNQDVASVVRVNRDVVAYQQSYAQHINQLVPWLVEKLVDNPISIDVSHMQEVIAQHIFELLEDVELLDSYAAYQVLHDIWTDYIEVDLEVLRAEGMQAATKVDPNMVIKKQQSKDVEVQDGWRGRIIPFDLVERILLRDEAENLTSLESQLAACISAIEQSAEELTEEDKELFTDALDDENAAWKPGALKDAIKSLQEEYDSTLQDAIVRLQEVQSLFKQQKELKSQIKKKQDQLHMACKATVEALDENQVRELLIEKWIVPIVQSLQELSDACVDEFVASLKALCDKYSVTFTHLNDEIAQAEQNLIHMMDELVGDEFDMAGLEAFSQQLGGGYHA